MYLNSSKLILWMTKVYSNRRGPDWSYLMTLLDPAHSLKPYFLNTHINIILPHIPRPPKWPLLFRFFEYNLCRSSFSQECYILYQFHLPWYCGIFTQTVGKQQLHKQTSTEKLLSIRSASRTLLCNAEVNTSLRCYASLLQLVDKQQWEMSEKFSVQSAQRLYNATLGEHQTVLVQ
jgi:hypothetical protein